MKKEMFINAQRDECRIAIVTDGALTELYTERASSLLQVGNIFKGRITNVEPSIQAAFVDFGRAKNGFLHISDVSPNFFPGGEKNRESEAVGRKRARKDRPPIQTCLKRGQELVVQVTKEGIGTKGATLTTYLSIPGRYLVLMPGMHRLGISRKIEDDSVRSKLRKVLAELTPPSDLGFIVRTAGIDQPKSNLQRDLSYLTRLWKVVSQRGKEARAPAELYQESDLVIRTIRDVYNTDIARVVCDDEAVACKILEFLQLIMPRTPHRVELYEDDVGLYHAFGLEQEMENINSRRVPMKSGGSLVIDQTEALVAIDVNSGRFRGADNAESMALRINTEAAHEVARQLRLRDLGGVIVIDFIDMTAEKHRRQIERIMRDELKQDRAKTKQLRMSQFGIIEITRQRVRPSRESSIFRACPNCRGSGMIKTEESQALAAMRTLRLAAGDNGVAEVQLSVAPSVADYILNQRRGEISRLEDSSGTRVMIHADASLPGGDLRIECTDERGSAIQWDSAAAMTRQPKDAKTREISRADAAEARKRLRASGKDEPQTPSIDVEPAEPDPEPKPKKKSRRRRRKSKAAKGEPGEKPADAAVAEQAPQAEAAPDAKPKSRRRRRKKKPAEAPDGKTEPDVGKTPAEPAQDGPADGEGQPPKAKAAKSRSRRKRSGRSRSAKAKSAKADADKSKGSASGDAGPGPSES